MLHQHIDAITLRMETNIHSKNEYADMKAEAQRTGFSRRQFHRLIQSRKIPAFKVGRKVILRPREVDAALEKFRIGAIGEKKGKK